MTAVAGSRYDDDAITNAALAAKAGDRANATAFVQMTQRQVYRFLAHLCDPGEVEDLTQETYLRAMSSLKRFAARSSARTWLLGIARRVAADQVRRNTRSPRTTSLDGEVEGSLHKQASGFEDEALLRRLLDALSPQRRDAFVATQVIGLSYAEAAAVCDCPVGTIRSRVARAREDLVSALDHDQGGRDNALRGDLRIS
jgi:RNA polymerase sigma-70 factor, ECF subfamily